MPMKKIVAFSANKSSSNVHQKVILCQWRRKQRMTNFKVSHPLFSPPLTSALPVHISDTWPLPGKSLSRLFRGSSEYSLERKRCVSTANGIKGIIYVMTLFLVHCKILWFQMYKYAANYPKTTYPISFLHLN